MIEKIDVDELYKEWSEDLNLRATYTPEVFCIAAITAKLNEVIDHLNRLEPDHYHQLPDPFITGGREEWGKEDPK